MTEQGSRVQHPLLRDGTSQNQRMLEALVPENTLIDERSFSDMLGYVHRYAELLQYYSPTNTVAGNWENFISNDPTVSAALLSGYQKKIDSFYKKLDTGEISSDEIFSANGLLCKLIQQVGDWYSHAIKGQALHTTLAGLGDKKEGLIRELIKLAPPTSDLGKYIKRKFEKPGLIQNTKDDSVKLENWDSLHVWLPLAHENRSEQTKIIALKNEEHKSTEELSHTINLFLQTVVSIINKAPEYVQKSLEYPAHQPHMALLLTFLQLFQHAREHLNTLTARHLDFYYHDILQLKNKPEQPDRVHLVFEPAQQLPPYRLAQGTLVNAGKDKQGSTLLYATEQEVVVTQARVDETQGVKTVFIKKDNKQQIQGLFAASMENVEGAWAAFGSEKMPEEKIGFAVASSIFLLAEGHRTITLDFETEGNPAGIQPDAEKLLDNITIYASGEKEWIKLSKTKCEVTEKTLKFTVTLEPADLAVTGYTDKVLQQGFNTTEPVIKFELTNGDAAGEHPYQYLKDIKIGKLDITVKVAGVKNLILENDLGVLNPAKPFMPFGPVPRKGSRFLVGSNEVFQKQLTSICVKVSWGDLPEQDFKTHYKYYKINNEDVVEKNNYFTANLSILENGVWGKGYVAPLFSHSVESSENTAAKNVINSEQLYHYSPEETDHLHKQSETPYIPFAQFNIKFKSGFLRFELQQSFLHDLYPGVLLRDIQKKNKTWRRVVPLVGNNIVIKQPYTPLIMQIALHYEAKSCIDFNEEDTLSATEQLFQITPLGYSNFSPATRFLLPGFPVAASSGSDIAQGTLYIGIKELQPPQNLSLLFQMAEERSYADNDNDIPVVEWAYLSRNTWIAFKNIEVLSDTTNGLLTTGILHFAVPKEISSDNTLLPAGLHWIKASVLNNSDAVSKIITIRTQAVTACYHNNGNDPSHLQAALPAGSIKKLETHVAGIKQVIQPTVSFDGQPPETDRMFYLRVSERLRHKNRAVSIFDYERLVLEKFPQVYRVKCLSHSNGNSEYAPGHVHLIVLPSLRDKHCAVYQSPQLCLSQNTLYSIQKYLQAHASDFVSITVSNPRYEPVTVHCSVIFQDGRDAGFCQIELHNEIVKFLSPWEREDAPGTCPAGCVSNAGVRNMVAKLDYVAGLMNFSLTHKYQNEDNDIITDKVVNEICGTCAGSVLISAEQHDITVKTPTGCQLKSSEVMHV